MNRAPYCDNGYDEISITSYVKWGKMVRRGFFRHDWKGLYLWNCPPSRLPLFVWMMRRSLGNEQEQWLQSFKVVDRDGLHSKLWLGRNR